MWKLFRDDAEGYHLNVEFARPLLVRAVAHGRRRWWRCPRLARPVEVSLSYHEAGRWLDAQETVEQVPVPPEVVEVLQAFVAENYQPEPKRRKRPDSFQPLQDQFGNPASVSTEKHRGGGGRGLTDSWAAGRAASRRCARASPCKTLRHPCHRHLCQPG